MNRFTGLISDEGGRIQAVVRMIVGDRQPKLFEVSQIGTTAGRITSVIHRGIQPHSAQNNRSQRNNNPDPPMRSP